MKALSCLVVLLALAACGGPPRDSLGGPALDCAGGSTVTMVADHDGLTRETRSPLELARGYAVHVQGSFRGEQRVYFESDDTVEIAVTSDWGRVTAKMTYSRQRDLGWRLQQAVSCAS